MDGAALIVALTTRRGERADRRLAVGLAGLLGVLVVLLVNTEVWYHLPSLLTTIQFAFRLHSYAAIVIAVLVVVALRLLHDAPGRRVWIAALAVALAAQTAIAGTSAWSGHGDVTHDQIVAARLPPAFGQYQAAMFRGVGVTQLVPPGASVEFDAAAVRGDAARAAAPAAAGVPVATNIVASPFVSIAAPWRPMGRDIEGLQVVEGGGRRDIVAGPASPWPIALARLLSLAAGAVVVVGGLLLAVGSWRRRALRR